MRSDRLLLAALLFAGACEIERVTIPSPPRGVVLHAVLSATSSTQVVLLERTYNGSVSHYLPPFDVEATIGSDSGIAESGARVALVRPTGDTLVAVEDGRNGGPGVGVYRFALDGAQLVRNASYTLLVRTARGEELSAVTSVPDGTGVASATSATYDRQDTIQLAWPASPSARSYFVRIETPYGPRTFFTDSTHLRLTGDLRNPALDAVPRVFVPGFPQAVTVSAVDANFYDWFRSHNDQISGRGVVNRVTGGLGVFGALVRVRFDHYDVVAPQVEPEAGHWVLVAGDLVLGAYPDLQLYVESRAARSDQADALSGRATHLLLPGQDACGQCGVLGTVRNGHAELALLDGFYARDTLDVFTGDFHGDTLTGRFRNIGLAATYVKQ